jgi:flagellar basal-body rod modification protein FlgD
MSINPTTTATTITATGTAGGGTQTGSLASVNENQFLQLMMAELQHQNPMNPNTSDPTQFVSQLAQFTTLEQETNTAQSTAQAAQQAGDSTALALLGHTVTYIDSTGATVTGTVQKVAFSSSGPTLTVNGVDGIRPTAVNEVS